MQKTIVETIKRIVEKEAKLVREDKKKQFTFFVLGFVFAYLIVGFLFGLLGQEFYKQATGVPAEALASIVGLNTKSIGMAECTENGFLWGEEKARCYSFMISDKQVIISWLCTGMLEIIILISAIIASFGIAKDKKIKGILAAIVLGFIFNQLRILITIIIVASQPIGVVELAHDLLFRIVLFVYITAFYVAWFYWAENK